ncbi:MAG: tripartite tricarboxylate transporter substrate binding protein [Burkholderiaceae bacterium]
MTPNIPRRPAPNRARRRAAALACALLLTVPFGAARAQDAYPNKPVKVIVPFPAGGVVDLVARAVCDRLAVDLGQPFVVEARPGASGNIGIEAVVRAPADGYTLLVGTPSIATNPLLMPATTKWKTADFAALGLVGAPPNVFVVPASLPVKTLKELVEHVKARPGQLNVTNPGIGTSNHLGQELLFSLTGLEMQNVMYKGQPQMIPDVASGQVSFSLMTLALAVPHIREGKLRALAVSAPRRVPDLPDVPTVGEAGFPDAMFLPWYGFVASAATPREIVKKLSDAIQKALASPDVIGRLEKIGALVTPMAAPEFDRLLRSESARWADVIRQRNIRPPE